ncbi:MAG: BPL-N domain-containing protein [Gemmatimonadaceae bacterium]
MIRYLLLFSFAVSACAPSSPGATAPILLFSGAGTSRNDVDAVEAILKNQHLEYTTANSRQLNAMNQSQLRSYRLLIMPGGNFIDMSESLSPGTITNIHNAVQDGVNYLGICAGAFLAAHGTYKSLDLTSGVKFGFYAAERQGIRIAALAITSINTTPIEHYWEDGPELSGWGDVVGKYPDGTPAIVQGFSGNGWVVLVGTHPEAPESWRHGMQFSTPASVAKRYTETLIEAALNGAALPHY